MISNQRRIALMWVVALTFYAACWFLPIMDSHVGYQGALIAHVIALRLFEDVASRFEEPVALFGVVFYAIGWMANELFVLGVVTVPKWPRFAVRSLAFSLGIMISWQALYAGAFPLLIGYWLWVAAGVMVLWLSAERLARQMESSVLSVLTDKVALALLLFPILNAAASATLGPIK